ncbi:MAG: hypothetical protein B7X55_09245 [Rhodobacterales bacterium 34-62-10]|nr:MAG: hypothetical protein B7X55_09245 [Rhodobacterales bacterium 34-62-10]
MTTPSQIFTGTELEIFAAAQEAATLIAPAFPLAATVAVNPFLGQAGQGRAQTAALLARVGGIRMFRDRADYAAALAAGRLDRAVLQAEAQARGLSMAEIEAALTRPTPAPEALPTVAELASAQSGQRLAELVEDRIGTWAAAHFDQGQALWPAPDGSAYGSWKAFATRDLLPGIAGLPGICTRVAALPQDARTAFAEACRVLGVTPWSARTYFQRLLMGMQGWGQYARHLDWLAARDGGRDTVLFEMLVIRLVWDMMLHEAHAGQLAKGWEGALVRFATPVEPSQDDLIDEALQDALERSEEAGLLSRLAGQSCPAVEVPAVIQAAFCIDVRSEVFRRALESVDAGIQTIGFAGFFGLAAAHRGFASDVVEARAPVLLRPGVTTQSRGWADDERDHRIAARATRAWGRFRMASVSAFAFVEAAGPLYVGKLLNDTVARAKPVAQDPAPVADLPLGAQVDAAAAILGAMSLTKGFARLVMIAGHGAGVTNAPHASALQCGACGGHAGDVNARLLAGLLNDDAVRAGLVAKGITVPADTRFIAGLHDTVSDKVTLFADTPLPDHAADLSRLTQALERAGAITRTERAATLPRADRPEGLGLRGGDWSELRPEWGLAGCAAFIAAPRRHTTGVHLGGRAFLHDYDWQADTGFGVLELILTAPVVVASWISLQYYGSSVAPAAFGAGNKLLHNVTGGIGVIEGNGGMLRAGLPWQSVHDGDALRHDPLRLTVMIEAPVEAITGILERHGGVKALFDNGWLALMATDAATGQVRRYERGTWSVLPGGAGLPKAA